MMHVGEKPYVDHGVGVDERVPRPARLGPGRAVVARADVRRRVEHARADSARRSAAGARRVRRDRARDSVAHGNAERFTVIAARGGEDVWVEVRRKPLEPVEGGAQAESPAAMPHVEVPAEHAVVPPASASEADVVPVHAQPVASEAIASRREPRCCRRAPNRSWSLRPRRSTRSRSLPTRHLFTSRPPPVFSPRAASRSSWRFRARPSKRSSSTPFRTTRSRLSTTSPRACRRRKRSTRCSRRPPRRC